MPTEVLINKFLDINGYNKNVEEFRMNFLSHPNYPSLYAITDTLSLIGIENVAANVPKSQLNELPIHFLAFLDKASETPSLALIRRDGDKITVTSNVKRKDILTKEDFLDRWSGIIIAVEPNETDNKRVNSLFLKIFFILSGLFVIYVLKGKFQISYSMFSYLLNSFGFLTSLFVIQEKLGNIGDNVSHLCSFSDNVSCDSVIKSEQTKITRWLDFSDLPILFFGSSILAFVIDTSTYSVINIISLFSVPIIIYSIFLQKVKLKKWCILCLSVSVLLIAQALLFIETGLPPKSSILSFLLATILTGSIWFFVKKILATNASLQKNNNELKRFKRNFNIFNSLLKPLKIKKTEALFNAVELGSKSAVNLSIIISPSCGYCHTAFEQALKLYNQEEAKNGIRLSVFYNLNPENQDNPYLDIAKNVMQINKNDPKNVIPALSDWHLKKMNLEAWLAKWRQENIEDESINDLRLQYEWCSQNGFNYTPVTILNEKEYPKEYDLDELKYFISDLE